MLRWCERLLRLTSCHPGPSELEPFFNLLRHPRLPGVRGGLRASISINLAVVFPGRAQTIQLLCTLPEPRPHGPFPVVPPEQFGLLTLPSRKITPLRSPLMARLSGALGGALRRKLQARSRARETARRTIVFGDNDFLTPLAHQIGAINRASQTSGAPQTCSMTCWLGLPRPTLPSPRNSLGDALSLRGGSSPQGPLCFLARFLI